TTVREPPPMTSRESELVSVAAPWSVPTVITPLEATPLKFAVPLTASTPLGVTEPLIQFSVPSLVSEPPRCVLPRFSVESFFCVRFDPANVVTLFTDVTPAIDCWPGPARNPFESAAPPYETLPPAAAVIVPKLIGTNPLMLAPPPESTVKLAPFSFSVPDPETDNGL